MPKKKKKSEEIDSNERRAISLRYKDPSFLIANEDIKTKQEVPVAIQSNSLSQEEEKLNSTKYNIDVKTNQDISVSHKQWRRHLKKIKRKKARQELAKQKEKEEAEEQRKMDENPEHKREKQIKLEEVEQERERAHEKWLEREKEQVEQIRRREEEENEKVRVKEEAEKKIRDEWESKEKVGEEEKQRKQELLDSEMEKLNQQNERPSKFSNFANPEPSDGDGLHQTHHRPSYQQYSRNPKQEEDGGTNNYFQITNPPTNWQSSAEFFLPEQDPRNCKFYIKTGACRFGQRCSRIHLKYENSPTILIQNFFQDARLAMPMLNEKNNDSAIEYEEVDMIHDFEKFYDDVIGEFRAAGRVVMFKCCQNYVAHLRGNVYVQYSNKEEAREAIRMFNGRYYAGRMLTVEQSPVTNWKSSICGLFDKRLCPRGKACNFLHVFRNPRNAYSVPNRTDFDPERAFRSGGYDPRFVNPKHPVFQYYSQRDAYGYRSSDIKKNINYGRNTWDSLRARSRSKSRDRDRRRRRSRSRGRSRSRSRSYSRSRSRSRSRHRHRRSRSRTRSRSRSRSHDRSRRRKHSRSSSKSSRSSGKQRKNSKNDSEISDTSTDWSDLSDDPIK